MKKVLKAVLAVVLAVVVVAAVYVGYVFISYHRLGDNIALEPVKAENPMTVKTETEYKMMSWNIGFGAYEDDYGFFMDGGTQSWAWSKDRLDANLKAIASKLAAENADFYIVQEVDFDSTRSYHFNEIDYLNEALPNMSRVFAQNYDSPFLFYPFTQPHGASKSGLLTYTKAEITSGLRRELPIEESLMKLLDLDRCYSVSRIPVEGSKELIIYNFHLSAYTSDGQIATLQLHLLLQDMFTEYKKGNYCIAGGDFNKDLLGNSSEWFGIADGEYTWAQPIPPETFEPYSVSLKAPLDKSNPVPSCRNADSAYHPGQFVVTVDGFMVTDNVETSNCVVIDTAFKNSDHNPVVMNFILK